MADKHLCTSGLTFAELAGLLADADRATAALSIKVVGSFEHEGRTVTLGFEAGRDEATNQRRLATVLFTLRQTHLALTGLLGPRNKADAERCAGMFSSLAEHD